MGKYNQTSVSNANEGMNPYTRPLEPYTLSQTHKNHPEPFKYSSSVY